MSRRTVFILVPVLLAVFLIGYWFLVLSPLMADISYREETIHQRQEELAALQTRLAQVSALREEAAKNEARLVELAKMVPTSEQMPSLILQIQDLAADAGIEFLSIAPGQASEAVGFQVIPLTLRFNGTYFDVNDFIYRAEQLVGAPGRLLAVSSVRLEPLGELASTTVSPKLNVEITLQAFERNPALEPSPQPSTAASTQPVTVE